MKILLTKAQWEHIGRIAGWDKRNAEPNFEKVAPGDVESKINDQGEFYGLITPEGDLFQCKVFDHIDLICFFENLSYEDLRGDMNMFATHGYIRVAINSKFSNYIDYDGSDRDIRRYRGLLNRIQESYDNWIALNKSTR